MDKHLLMELYKAHLSSKDVFTDRFFALNKFYLCTVIILVTLGMFFLVEEQQLVASSISVVGAAISILWWLNQDAYNIQIKIKYRTILNKLEDELQLVTPLQDEFAAFQNELHKKKMFIFPDTLKFFSISMFFIFLVMFLYSFIPAIMNILQ